VKVVQPTRLVAEAAEVLEATRDDVVVVGAAALEIALSDADTFVTPTRDVDVVVPTERVVDVVRELEASGLERSREPHEARFTWVRDELKVQLVRAFHPFPKGVARGLPQNAAFGMASDRAHADQVAFAESPEVPRLWSANAACLLALKQAAFGRKRGPDAEPVERDFHDAYLLLEHAAVEIAAQLRGRLVRSPYARTGCDPRAGSWRRRNGGSGEADGQRRSGVDTARSRNGGPSCRCPRRAHRAARRWPRSQMTPGVSAPWFQCGSNLRRTTPPELQKSLANCGNFRQLDPPTFTS
jgi:hypothetical protein